MADPRREAPAVALAAALGVGVDRIVWDQKRDRWDTGVRSWQAHDPDADWHLVIQDDAIVCLDLLAGLEKALGMLPERSVASLYSSGKSEWVRRGTKHIRWIRHRSLIWGVAMAAPVSSIDPMLAWCERNHRPNYDNRIARYYDWLRWPAYYTYPSLTDHGRVPSLLDHPDGRHAHRFLGENTSALEWVRKGYVKGPRDV